MTLAELKFKLSTRREPTPRKFAGFDVMIENPRGTIRSGVNRQGKKWSTLMRNDYGFLKRGIGQDGEGLDVFLGDNPLAENAYIIHQNDPETGKYDEDKAVLGADFPEAAKALYLRNYSSPDFYRSTTIIPVEQFRKMLTNGQPGGTHWKKKHGRDLEAVAMFEAEHEGVHQSKLTGGEWKTINGARVYIKDGSVEAGPPALKGEKMGKSPAHLIGKTEAEVERHGKAAAPEKAKPGYHRIERDANGKYRGTHGPNGLEHNAEHAERLKNLKIAPGYTKVHLANDPEAGRQAYQTDSKGRETRVYTQAHHDKQAIAKFVRVKGFVNKLPEVRASIENDPSHEAGVLRLIDKTGIRIGSDRDTGADAKAFGASTLKSEHIVTTPEGKTALHFTGKKGVQIHQEIGDESLANELKERAKSGGKLYNTTAEKVRDRLHKDAPGFNVKDFRTAVAADTAMDAMKGVEPPKNLKELLAKRGEVATKVAAKLGNTPTVALKSYIPPEVFSEWQSKAANLEQAAAIEKYAADKGLDTGTAAKEWIGQHAAKFREDFNRGLKKGVSNAKPTIRSAAPPRTVGKPQGTGGGKLPGRADVGGVARGDGSGSGGSGGRGRLAAVHFSADEGDEVWRTIGAVDHHGGSRVRLNKGTGEIVKGHHGLIGHNVKRLSPIERLKDRMSGKVSHPAPARDDLDEHLDIKSESELKGGTAGSSPQTPLERLKAKMRGEPSAVAQPHVPNPSSASVQRVKPHSDSPKLKNSTDGWKLHLATDKPEEVSTYLKSKGIAHKVGRSGGQEGKDITAYVGHRDTANAAAGSISKDIGHLLNKPHGDTLSDDAELAPNVVGRFDISGTDHDFHQYGKEGVPFLIDDVHGMSFGNKLTTPEKAKMRAHAELQKRYGAFYSGRESAGKHSGLEIPPVKTEGKPLSTLPSWISKNPKTGAYQQAGSESEPPIGTAATPNESPSSVPLPPTPVTPAPHQEQRPLPAQAAPEQPMPSQPFPETTTVDSLTPKAEQNAPAAASHPLLDLATGKEIAPPVEERKAAEPGKTVKKTDVMPQVATKADEVGTRNTIPPQMARNPKAPVEGLDNSSVPPLANPLDFPHKHTAEDYISAVKADRQAKGLPVHVADIAKEHEDAVAKAAKEGHDIPLEVLAEHAHIKAPHTHQQAGSEAEPPIGTPAPPEPSQEVQSSIQAPPGETDGASDPVAKPSAKVNDVKSDLASVSGPKVDAGMEIPPKATTPVVKSQSELHNGNADSEATHEPKSNDATRGTELGRREPVADDGGNGGGQSSPSSGAGQGPAKINTIRAEHTIAADPSLIHESIRQHLAPHQIQATAKSIAAMDKHGGFLNMSGTGAGKTRTALATAKTYADRGNKVLIVTPKKVIQPDFKKGSIAGSYNDDALAMGIPTTLNDGEGRLEPGKIHVTTYDRLKKLKGQIGKDTTVIFDEAHAGKNYSSDISGDMREAGNAARNAMYATATPADKPMHVGAYGRANIFGNSHPFETFKELGMRHVDQHVGGGRYQKVWQRDPKISDAEAERRMSGLFDRMTKEGLAIKHEVGMDNATVENKTVHLPQEAHELMGKIAGNYGEHQRAQSLMAQRLQQEPYKIQAAVDSVKADLAAGRRPIVFAGRVNASTVGGEDGDDENAIAHSEGTLKTLKEKLAAEGINDVSEVHGGVSDAARAKGVSDFQAGKNRVLIGTVNSAGTGINLDDTSGGAPRTLTNMTAPFSANEVVQAAGRVNRLSTKSPAIIRNLYANTDVDDWNRGLTENKLRTLGAAVGGDVRKLDMDYSPEAQTEPYQWRSLTSSPEPRSETKSVAKLAIPAPSSTTVAKPEAQTVPTKIVNTRNGARHVHSFVPSQKFWSDRKAGNLPSSISVSKNPRTGAWEAAIWGNSPEDVAKSAKSLADRGIHANHFHAEYERPLSLSIVKARLWGDKLLA